MSGSLGLLHRAITYALDVIPAATPDLLSRPTPCEDWDLRTLLRHANESLTALQQGAATGRIGLHATPDDDPSTDPVLTFHARARRLLEAWTAPGPPARLITIEDCPLPAGVTASVGALEIAVHSWDISQACGQRRPIPRSLATDLLAISPLLITEATRYPLFAAPITLAPAAGPSDRLIAFLGRG
ncbi:MAG TPA: TIGR03086 family metal-binding protein [Pseudonocardia sp.]|uniref:TIGR03086 family metal-binding protein n=1 Tax=Pseudonocardia sp. TaxID=60912 RepID=UPI002CEFAC16|nr:TIGR03086 family metal-binding protein [Pseudonocardia sp.]HTF48366.1 TIGR03086 family metal-binding protein [Pseudonocardia sp.]